jgi:hypothetical protein
VLPCQYCSLQLLMPKPWTVLWKHPGVVQVLGRLLADGGETGQWWQREHKWTNLVMFLFHQFTCGVS